MPTSEYDCQNIKELIKIVEAVMVTMKTAYIWNECAGVCRCKTREERL